MPIDLAKARTAKLPPSHGSWGPDNVILYHLGIGAGVGKATDPKELEYTYERNLKVLPSFAVVPVFGALGGINAIPGVEINMAMVLHGEQDVEIHRPIPVRGADRERGAPRRHLRQGQGGADRHRGQHPREGRRTAVHQPVHHLRARRRWLRRRGRTEARQRGAGPRARRRSRPPRPCRTRRCSTGSPATRTRCTPIPTSPSSAASTRRSCTASAPSASSARRSSTACSAATVDEGGPLPGPFRRRRLPGRDHRHVDVARWQQDPDRRQDEGARHPGDQQRGDHATLRRVTGVRCWVPVLPNQHPTPGT